MPAKYSVTILLLLSILVSACGAPAPQQVKVLVSLPLTIDVGKDMLNGMQLALQDAGGKAGSVSVEILSVDTADAKGSPLSGDTEVANIQKNTADKTVVGFIGSVSSGLARTSAPVLNAIPMAQISPSATWPGLTKPGFGAGEPGVYFPTGRRHFFRLVPSDDVQGLVAVHWVHTLAFKTAFIVSDGSPYSEGLAGIFEANASDEGVKVLGHQQFAAKTAKPDQLMGLASSIVAAKPDILYYPVGMDEDAYPLILAVRNSLADLPVMGGDALLTLTIPAQAQKLSNLYSTQVMIDPSQLPGAADFVKKFQDNFHKAAPNWALYSYESMRVMLLAIQHANPLTREGVLSAMTQLGDISSTLGTWHFDANGDTSLTSVSGWRLTNGQWNFLQIIK